MQLCDPHTASFRHFACFTRTKFVKFEEKKVTNNHEDKKSISEVIVPSLGESITEATIGKWMKSLGQEVFKGEPLVEIETDKVTQELYAEDNGIIKELLFKEQEEVKIGEVIAILELKKTLVNSKKELSDESKDKEEKRSISKMITETKSESEILDNDLDPTAVKRTGIGNKVTMLDLVEFSNDLSFSPAAKKNIREITMFPMNQNAQDLLMNAPSEVSNDQLKELCLKIIKKN